MLILSIVGREECFATIKPSSEYDSDRVAEQIISYHKPILFFEFCGLIGCKLHNYTMKEWYSFFKKNNYTLYAPYAQSGDEKFIIKHLNVECNEMQDLVAIPNNLYTQLTFLETQ